MTQPNNTTKSVFDDLFNRLLSAVAEEHDIKANGGTVTALIDVRDRLQGLRSDLAAVRERLVAETTKRLSDPQATALRHIATPAPAVYKSVTAFRSVPNGPSISGNMGGL